MKIQHIGVSQYTRPGRKLRSISNIVWHYTANPGASAANHFKYFSNLTDRYASAHIFIDKDEAIEIIPLDEVAYHAGDGVVNASTIGIELCIEKDGSFHPSTLNRAAEVAVMLCKKFNIDPMEMIRHYDVTKKRCPLRWVEHPSEFFEFKVKVKNALKGEAKMKPEDANKIIGLLGAMWNFCQSKEDRLEIGRLADELRAASGQPKQNS